MKDGDVDTTGGERTSATQILPHGSSQPYALYTVRQRQKFLAVLFLVTTSSYFDYNVLSITLQPIKQEFHVSDTMLGLLSGFVFALIYCITALPIARWADHGNRRTVITLAVATWSIVTMLCGAAQSFWQLAFARFGLGAVEAGAIPPSQSLIIDYFPLERRATASAILSAGGAAGYLVGVGLGGYIADIWGWRSSFIFAGASGLFLAFVVRMTLAEPRCQLGFPSAVQQVESAWDAVSYLKRKRTFVYAVSGISLYATFSFGIGTFLPSFMMRTLHASLLQVSLTWGLAVAAANLSGAVLGGSLADRLTRYDVRWYGWQPAAGILIAAPFYYAALTAHDLTTFIVLDFVAESLVTVGISVCFMSVLSVAGACRRTVAVALVQLSFMLVGGGLGPLLAGALSDAFTDVYGAEGIRYSLISMLIFLVPAAAALQQAGREIPEELEE